MNDDLLLSVSDKAEHGIVFDENDWDRAKIRDNFQKIHQKYNPTLDHNDPYVMCGDMPIDRLNEAGMKLACETGFSSITKEA